MMETIAGTKSAFKRLVLCLDGTWNTQDSNTSIFHLSNLVADVGADGVRQLVYYEEGVGTGMFDSFSGGVFGFGINENIRHAYEWLIEKYEDGDEIYLFGFSRGAFTARTLGGLISKLGLLRPGAPMSVTELWEAYTLIGRVEKPEKNWWESVFGKHPRPCRSLIELKWDDGTVKVTDPNRTEKLLIQWSRRPDIHCVGIFDTVGALGWDALAIPWLRTHIAQFHNTNLNILTRHGFHALAIDEQRPMFNCVPWRKFVPAGPAHPPSERERTQVIEQRWFTGAHSNIGGGYEDNPLSLFPLCWMMERVAGIGLGFRGMLSRPNITDCVPLVRVDEAREEDRKIKKPYLRDSYAEFFHGILRPLPLRKSRTIAAPPVAHDPIGSDASIGEVIDESVAQLWKADPSYRPGNLQDYYQRMGQTPPA